MIKMYVVGLYLEQKSSDPDAIVQAYAPKQIVMQFLHGVKLAGPDRECIRRLVQ
jgi:hypothetical protein